MEYIIIEEKDDPDSDFVPHMVAANDTILVQNIPYPRAISLVKSLVTPNDNVSEFYLSSGRRITKSGIEWKHEA